MVLFHNETHVHASIRSFLNSLESESEVINEISESHRARNFETEMQRTMACYVRSIILHLLDLDLLKSFLVWFENWQDTGKIQ